MEKVIKERREHYYNLLYHLIEIGANKQTRNNAHQRYIAICELQEAIREDKKNDKEKG
jgi:hypothetical protein